MGKPNKEKYKRQFEISAKNKAKKKEKHLKRHPNDKQNV
jgi:hypothetical protein